MEELILNWKHAVDLILENHWQQAVAFMLEDPIWTLGTIWKSGEPNLDKEPNECPRLGGVGIPVIMGDDGRVTPCYVLRTYSSNPHGWQADSWWPQSVLFYLDKRRKEEAENGKD